MFTRVEVRNFKSLRDVSVPLSNFHVLVGANGSGKSSFLDVFAFMGDLLTKGVQEAISDRTNNFKDLTFLGRENTIELAFEAKIPDSILEKRGIGKFDSVRYEISFNWDKEANSPLILEENCFIFDSDKGPQLRPSSYYSEDDRKQNSIFWINNSPNPAKHKVISRPFAGPTMISSEIGTDRFVFTIKGDQMSLANLPQDETKFPATIWFMLQFKKFIQPINLESEAINKAGTEGRKGIVTHDGSNLPWLIASLKKTAPDRYKRWIRHVQIVLPEIKSINTVLREDQDDMFLKIKYNEGNEVKQWMVSDGTLRLLLLTIIPYLLNLKGLFLIEEPEIGINPLAIQAIMDSLRSVWDEQVFVTTHSPEVVNCVMKKDLLLFIKNETGETQIISGTEHRGLTNWTLDIGSGVFYGAGIMR